MPTIQLALPTRTQIAGINAAPRPSCSPRGLSLHARIRRARPRRDDRRRDGNRFIDFAGGIGCTNVGHRSDRVVSAIREQLDRFLHTCFSVAPYEDYISVAEKLNKITPGDFAKKTILVNSGAEAIENAIKIARCYTQRPAIICFEDAFHGRTMLTMSLTSKTHPYKAGFEPFAADIYRIPFAYCYRCSYSLKYPRVEFSALITSRHIQARSCCTPSPRLS